MSLVDWINPFILHTHEVFEAMLGWTLHRESLAWRSSHVPTHDISGVMQLSGKTSGTVVLSLRRNVAIQIASVLLDKQIGEINSEVADAVGELTNIISGRAAADLASLQTRVGLPNVVIGRTKTIYYPPRVTPLCVGFRCESGELTLEVGLSMDVSLSTRETWLEPQSVRGPFDTEGPVAVG